MSRILSIFKIAILMLLVLIAAGAIFLSTFDLNSYRQQLAESFSEAIGMPVRIGQLQFALLPSPSLDCLDLAIGDAGSDPLQVKADHLYLKLQLLPLLMQRFEFTEISLQHPVIKLTSFQKQTSDPPPPNLNAGMDAWLHRTRVQRLRLNDAEILLVQGSKQLPTAINLQLFLDNFRPGETGTVKLEGALKRGQVSTPFAIEGSIRFQDHLSDWRSRDLGLKGELRKLSPEDWLKVFGIHPPALILDRIDRAGIDLLGQPATGLKIDLSILGEQLVLRGSAFKDLHLPSLRLTTRWTTTDDVQQFDQIELGLGRTRATGSMSINHPTGAGNIEFQLGLDSPLKDLGMLIPVTGNGTPVELFRKAIQSGGLHLKSKLAMPLSELTEPGKWLQRLQLEASVDQASLTIGALGQLSDLDFQLQQQEGRLQLTSGHFSWLDERFELAGTTIFPVEDPGNLNLSIEGELDAGQILPLLPEKLQGNIALSGKVPTRVTLSGPFDNLLLTYHSNVKYLQGQFGSAYYKPAGLEGTLLVEGVIRDHTLQISKAGLNLFPFDLSAQGSLGLTAEHRFHAELKLSAIDLQRAQFRSPLLAQLKTRGQLTANCSFDSDTGDAVEFDGRISFQDFGLHLTRVLADLQQINGQMRFSEQGLEFEGIGARLGESPVTLQGGIDSWEQPEIRLRVQSDAIRANELIFPSETILLHDLDGRLKIDRNGIDFESVKVRLDGGTVAHVQGRLESYRSPRVALDITAEYGNIDEVIALWKTSRPRSRLPREPGSGLTTTEISVHADQGQIGPLEFSKAEALLKTDGLGHLVILPLTFHHGEGYVVGHVALDRSRADPSLLMLSGHVENFDAAAIYRDLLHRDGLVSGVTRGDFFLQGEPGKNFLATSSGGISLQINKGTLYRLPLISKVFSLLNVSQILTLNAPEMSSEGMPFSNISGSFAMDKGVLSTDNLVIHSNSMDMSLILEEDMKNRSLKGILGVKPLKTVDKIITKIPLVGWILGGEEKAVLTAHFNVSGSADNPEVTPAPATSIAAPIMGIFVRTLQLPGKMVTDISEALNANSEDDDISRPPPAAATPPPVQ